MACLSQESLLVSPSLTGHKVVCLQSLFMLGPGLQPPASAHTHSDRFSQQRSTGSGKCPLWSELAPSEQTDFLCRDPPLPLSSGQQGRVLNPGPHRSSPLLSPHREIRVLERGVSDSLPHDGFSTGTHSPLGCGGWGWKRHSLFRPPVTHSGMHCCSIIQSCFLNSCLSRLWGRDLGAQEEKMISRLPPGSAMRLTGQGDGVE